MPEEEGVLTPVVGSPYSSSPLHGIDVSPFNEHKRIRDSCGERRRISIFQGDGLDAFLMDYGDGEGIWKKQETEVLFPPGPMDRFEVWEKNKDVPWQPSAPLGDDTVGKSGDSREDSENKRRLSSLVENALKAFPDTEEPLTPTTISKPTFIAGQRRLSFPDMDDVPDDVPDGFSCTEETLVLTPESSSIVTANADDINHEDDISVDDMPERLIRDLWVPAKAQRQEKRLSRKIRFVRERRSSKKEVFAEGAHEEAEEARSMKRKAKGKGKAVAADQSGVDNPQRQRGFSLSDEDEKRAKMAKVEKGKSNE